MAQRNQTRRSEAQRKRESKILLIILAVIAVCSLIISLNERYWNLDFIPTWNQLYSSAGLDDDKYVDNGNGVAVHYIDVGQGDSQLIVTPQATMLIDTGERDYASTVINYLSHQNIDSLDYVMITHPHSDHSGGFTEIMDSFPAKYVILPDIADEIIPTTSTYTKMLKSISKHNMSVIYAKPNDEITLSEDVTLELLAPITDYDDLNNYSVVAKLVHLNNSFLFTGDIEAKAENDILDANMDVSADVYKAAHHGSKTSNTEDFLEAVGGKYAVIGVGSPNSYGHPHERILDRLGKYFFAIYRTDVHGNIVFLSDGNNFSITYQKGDTIV